MRNRFRAAIRAWKIRCLSVLEKAIEAFLAEIEETVAQGCGLCGAVDPAGRRAYRKQRVPARAIGLRQHGVGDLIDRIALDARAIVGAIDAPGARPQQAHEIIELSCGGDGGARIARLVLLADGDGWRDAEDLVDVGLLHALQELAGVSRE